MGCWWASGGSSVGRWFPLRYIPSLGGRGRQVEGLPDLIMHPPSLHIHTSLVNFISHMKIWQFSCPSDLLIMTLNLSKLVRITWSEKSAKNGEEMQKNVIMKQLVWRNKFAKSNGVRTFLSVKATESQSESVNRRYSIVSEKKIRQIMMG